MTNDANWARDGEILTDDFSLFVFFVRGLLQLCDFLCKQLPPRFRVRINAAAFLMAFSMFDTGTGERRESGSWNAAPNGRSSWEPHEATETPQEQYAQKWNKRVDAFCAFVPSQYNHIPASELTGAASRPVRKPGKGSELIFFLI